MSDSHLTPEQEAELEELAMEVMREAARVGVDWDAAAERMRALAAQEELAASDDGMTHEITLSLDLSVLLATLRRLPEGAGTERFLAAYEAVESDEPPAA